MTNALKRPMRAIKKCSRVIDCRDTFGRYVKALKLYVDGKTAYYIADELGIKEKCAEKKIAWWHDQLGKRKAACIGLLVGALKLAFACPEEEQDWLDNHSPMKREGS